MSYTVKNFQTKKQLKDAVNCGEKVTCFQPGLGPNLSNFTGTVYLEGPHYPQSHKWYAQAVMVNGVVKTIK